MGDQSGETSEETHPEINQRFQSRQRVTLSMKRIREIVDKGQVQDNKTRLKKEIQQLNSKGLRNSSTAEWRAIRSL